MNAHDCKNFKKLAYEMYVADWKRSHKVTPKTELDLMRNLMIETFVDGDAYVSYKYYVEEIGGYPQGYPACFDEFCDIEYLDKEYMHKLLKNKDLIKLYDSTI